MKKKGSPELLSAVLTIWKIWQATHRIRVIWPLPHCANQSELHALPLILLNKNQSPVFGAFSSGVYPYGHRQARDLGSW